MGKKHKMCSAKPRGIVHPRGMPHSRHLIRSHDGAYLRARLYAALGLGPGKTNGTRSQLPLKSPMLSPSTGLDLVSTRSNQARN